jgi:hypothetical protein
MQQRGERAGFAVPESFWQGKCIHAVMPGR